MPLPPGPPPIVTAISPTSGIPGTNVVVSGNNLSASYGTHVYFNGVIAAIKSQTNTSMVVIAPASSTGPVHATSLYGASASFTFTYVAGGAPTISSVNPVSGGPGSSVVITGTNFGASQGASTVTFNGVAAAITIWSSTSITATVPSTASTGPVVVTVGGIASNGVTFTVTTPSNGGIPGPLNQLLIPGINFNAAVQWTFDVTNFNDNSYGSFYNWKVEDVIAGRTPTISRVILSYHDLGVANITLTLTGTNDEQAVVSTSVPVTIGTVAASGRIVSQVIGMTLTGQNLQLTLTRQPNAGPVSITKVRMEGRVETTVY